MADNTKIEWTDATWNPITGCSVISPGCTNCYAMKLAGTRLKHHPSREGLTIDTKAGPVWNGEVRFNEAALTQPLEWRKPRGIFVCAHGDLFHENVPDEWIDKVFAIMALCPQHKFQVLTKRADRMCKYLGSRSMLDAANYAAEDIRVIMTAWLGTPSWRAKNKNIAKQIPRGKYCQKIAWPLPNVWLGVSVEDQVSADKRIPLLMETPAAVRWISAEPLLGPVDLTRVVYPTLKQKHEHDPYIAYDTLRGHMIGPDDVGLNKLDWVVAGGESGPGARRMQLNWARTLRDQCAAAGVPFFFKQWGVHDEYGEKLGTRKAGRLLDGTTHDEYPKVAS